MTDTTRIPGARPARSAPSQRASLPSHRLRLLLVEDSPADALFVQELVADWADVHVVERVVSAVEALDAEDWDAVLLDMGLPDARGLEGLATVRASHPSVPVVVLTGADEQLAAEALRSGAQDYLRKGDFDEASLMRAVMHGLVRHRRVSQIEGKRRHAETRAEGLRSVLDAVPDALVLYDGLGRIAFANEQAREWLIPVGTIQLESLGLGTPASLEPARRGPIETRLRVGGRDRFLRVRLVRTRWAGRELDCLLVRDETQEKLAEAAAAAVRESERLVGLGQLAASVAHEINNPLAAIAANLEALRAEPERAGEPAGRGMLDDSLEASRRVAVIVSDLLTFARADAAEVTLVRLERVLDACVNLTANRVRQHGIEIVRRFGSAPPVAAVEGRLLQVASNLLTNALDALRDRGAGSVVLETGTWEGGPYLAVEDDGPGMSADVLAQAQEPFFTTKTHVGGTGLGLSVSSDIARAHGGDLVIDSAPGRGTRVVLRLPWETGLPVDGARPPSAPPTEPPPAGDAYRVMLVDDDGMVRRAYQRLLAPECRVRAFSSAAEALAALHGQSDVDLIICDVEMPGMNGLAFLEALETAHPALVSRLVFYTGGVFESDRASALVERGVRLLTKPVARATLLEIVARVATPRKESTV